LDNRKNPEVAALKELKGLAIALRETVNNDRPLIQSALQAFLQEYGYLSEVGTDIAVPTWQEQPEIVENLLLQFLEDDSISPDLSHPKKNLGLRGTVQKRLDLKGQVTIVYSRLLAELRACFVTLEKQWITSGLLQQYGDIFYLEFTEIKTIVSGSQDLDITQKINDRRQHFTDYQTLTIPSLVYGFNPPDLGISAIPFDRLSQPNRIQGIGASQGIVEGVIKRVKSFQSLPQILATIDRQTILVVPYTDSGWAPLLAQAGGLIAEVGGQLSHGAIVAREYGIPAVMNVSNALSLFQDGDRVRLDGGLGTIDRSRVY
jgi:pyruvate,water dikinase